MDKVIDQLKEYAGLLITLFALSVGAGVAYGSASATASVTLDDQNKRLTNVEQLVNEDHVQIAKMSQHIDDIWHDNGH